MQDTHAAIGPWRDLSLGNYLGPRTQAVGLWAECNCGKKPIWVELLHKSK